MPDKERDTKSPANHVGKVYRTKFGTNYIVLGTDKTRGYKVANLDRFFFGDIPDDDLFVPWETGGEFVTDSYVKNHPITYNGALKKYDMNKV